MAELFDVGVPAINKHLNNIFKEGELSREATISKMEIVQNEGTREVKRMMEFYSLDAIMIPKIKFHGFRHSFATRCIESNCDYKTVSVLLGHSNII